MNTPRMLLATVGMWSAFFTSWAVKADELKQSGIITSVAASATFSTKGMSPGAQIVASWQTLPPGGKVEIPKADKGMWAHLHLGLSGSGVLLGDISPECRFFRVGPTQDTSSLEINANPGDGFACNYSVSELWGGVHRVENRGTEPYVSAKLDIGGPWSEGMVNVGLEFDKAGALNKPMGIDPAVYSVVEGEILKAGAMTVTIRQVTMPPGARIVFIDRYPTMRMVTDGLLEWGVLPPGANATLAPKVTFTKERLGQLLWGLRSTDSQIVLSNQADKPVKYLEWTVTPVEGTPP